MAVNLTPPADATNTQLFADWVEITTVRNGAGVSALVELDLVLRQTGFDGEELDGRPTDIRRDELIEGVINDVTYELQRRSDILADSYPFTVATNGGLELVDDWRLKPTYVFCICLSVGGVVNHGIPRSNPASIFEEISTAAASEYFGGDGFKFGFPRGAAETKRFIDALKKLSLDIGEGTINERRANWSSQKDAGVDIVVWKHFPDHQPGKFIMYGQCKAGKDWVADLGKPNFSTMGFFFPIETRPVRAMFIPHYVEFDQWEFRAQEANGLLFDRFRVTKYAGLKIVGGSIPANLISWTEAALEEIEF